MNWTVSKIEECKASLMQELAASYPLGDAQGRLAHLIAALNDTDRPPDSLAQFIHCLLILEYHSRSLILNETEYRNFEKMATLSLKAAGADQRNSRLSFLLGELHLIKCQLLLRKGETDHAAWYAELSAKGAKNAPADFRLRALLLQGDALLRMGHARLANIRFRSVEESGFEDYVRTARKRRIAADRWSGNPVQSQMATVDFAAEERLWLSSTLNLQTTGDFEQFLRQVKREVKDPEYLLQAKLWLYCSSRKNLADELPKVDTLRRKLDKSSHAFELRALQNGVRTFEEAYDTNLALNLRLENIGELFKQRSTLPSVEMEILVLGAIIRFLQKHSQPSLLQLVVAEYQSLSRRLSLGTNTDALRLMPDLDLIDLEIKQHTKEQRPGSRTGAIVKTAAKGAAIVATSRIKRMAAASAEKERLKQEEFAKLGTLLAESFGSLKGGMMKVGQLLSLIADISPGFVNPLRRMHLDAEATPVDQVERVIMEEFGQHPDELFQQWDREPLAIGSVGQAHRAVLLTGEQVVLKVQHPDVGKSLQTDLKLLGIIRPIIKHYFPKADSHAIIEEIRQQLMMEIDYRREANNQEFFRQVFINDPAIVVPRLFGQYCSDRVLTSEYIAGQSFEDFCRASTQEQRNKAGEIIVRSYLTSIWPYRRFNCDPHTNNYLFLEDGRIALLDYGCVKYWDKQFVDAWEKIILAGIHEDRDGCFEGFVASGSYPADSTVDRKLIMDTARIMCEPAYEDKPYQFSHEFVRRNSDALYFANNELKKYFTPPAESTMMIRFSLGLYTILSDLGATANWHQIVIQHFKHQHDCPVIKQHAS